MIEAFYSEEHRGDYFASRLLFKKWKDEKGTHEKIIPDVECTFIRRAKNGEYAVRILETYDTGDDGIIEKFMFLPAMELKKRQCVYCQGQAGSGKSYLLDDYVDLYKIMHPRNEVLYFTLNSAEIDVSLTLKNYRIMKMQDFFNALYEIRDNLEAIKKIGEQFANKLLVFDDVGNLKNDKKIQKTFWNFIDQSIENFRKFDVSVYIIAHSSRTGTHGCIMKEEMTHYIISGNALQQQNDRIMNSYFGLKMKKIEELLSRDDRWLCIDTKKRVAIYPSYITVI